MAAEVSGAGPRWPRVVASDLDGTLLGAGGVVSARTAQVWSALAGAGVETVIVTARPPRWLHHLESLVAHSVTGARSVAICAGGAFVYDVARREVLERHGFTPAQARAVVATVLDEFPGGAASFETDQGAFRTPEYHDSTSSLGSDDDVTVGPLEHVPDDVVVGKVLVRNPRWVDDAFVPQVERCVGEAGVLAYSGAQGLAEIMAPGVTKAARLATWCAERGIAREDVWAFGDMPNDLPMLSWAGHGVAVANSHAQVLAQADAVCGSNDENGVAEYLAQGLNLR